MRTFILSLAVSGLLLANNSLATTTITPTTTLTAQTANNTSTAATFTAQSNGNIGPSNISKVPTRTLLYPGATSAIYAHFMAWFGTTYHMDIGYTSSDSAQVARQVTDAISRGISGFILDWYGPGEAMPNDTTYVLKSEAESRQGAFVFAIMEDGGALSTCHSTAGCDVSTQFISDLTYAYNNFEGSPAYMKIGGRPVVFTFADDRYGTLDWARIAASVPGNPLLIFQDSSGFSHAVSSGSIAWVMINKRNRNDWGQGYLDNYYATALTFPLEHPYGATYSGFNDTLASWGSNRIMNQNCGQTWLSTFSEIGKYYGGSKPQLESLGLVTWNDYEEGTEIETGVDNCASVAGAVLGTQLTWNISGSESTIDHYSVFISGDGENLMPLADVPAGTHSLDLAGYGFASGTYTMYVKAVGKPSIKNQMSPAITFLNSKTADFAMSALPGSKTVSRGASASYAVTVTPTNGFSGAVSFTLSGLPPHTNASFSPGSVTGSGTSPLTVMSGPLSTGTYTLTITGTSGTLSHSTKVTLTVQ